MAGLIDVGILKPELADYGRMEQQRNLLAQQKQQSELSQIKLDQLKQDQAMLMDLRTRLRAAGKSDDPTQFFQEMIRTGDPDYMSKGYEGLERYKDLKAYAKLGVIEPIDAAPTMPTGAPAPAAPVASVVRMPQAPAPTNRLGSGTFGMEPTAPVNAMAPAAAVAPVNALATQPNAQIAQTQMRIDQLVNFARTNPRMAKQAIEEAKFLQDQLEFASRRAPATPTKIQEYEYAKRNGYQGSFTDFTTLHAPRTTVNVPVNVSTEKKYGEQFAGKFAEKDIDKLTAAEAAPAMAENANRIISLVSQGNVFTGPIADVKLNIARALNVVGASNEEKIANTETLIASTGQSTLNAIKGAGLGTGQGFTDKDLKFLQGIAGGTIGLTQKTLMDLATLQHRVATLSAEAWNKRAPEIPKDVARGVNMSTAPIKVAPLKSIMGGATRPAGVGANWTFESDAAGNKAWVSPDRKSFKEAQ